MGTLWRHLFTGIQVRGTVVKFILIVYSAHASGRASVCVIAAILRRQAVRCRCRGQATVLEGKGREDAPAPTLSGPLSKTIRAHSLCAELPMKSSASLSLLLSKHQFWYQIVTVATVCGSQVAVWTVRKSIAS